MIHLSDFLLFILLSYQFQQNKGFQVNLFPSVIFPTKGGSQSHNQRLRERRILRRTPTLSSSYSLSSSSSSLSSSPSISLNNPSESPPKVIPSSTDRARTITHLCTGGTLCTLSTIEDVKGYPYGSYVDFVLDEKGWPVLLLNNQSLHTHNIRQTPQVSLFCQLPNRHPHYDSTTATTVAALSRVNIMGRIIPVNNDELTVLKFAYILVHPYAEQIADSNKFSFVKVKPEKIYFTGGFGVMSTWINVEDYELAKPDVIAPEVPNVLSKINDERQGELILICKHYLNLDNVEHVRIQTIDHLGIDLRVKRGDFTDEYRVAFRHPVVTTEDAKSELMKIFQEVWEIDNGYLTLSDLPHIIKYAEDILRSSQRGAR